MLVTKLRKIKKKWKKGFTLVELLVALTISVIMGMSIFMILNAASGVFADSTQEIVADDVKDLVLSAVKSTLYAKQKIVLGSNQYIGEGGSLNIDTMKNHHAIFSSRGRVYKVASDFNMTQMPELNDNMLLLENSAYDRYDVKLSFVPVYNNAKNKYVALQIVLEVYDGSRLVTTGTETFRLMNMERLSGQVKFQFNGNNTICYYV